MTTQTTLSKVYYPNPQLEASVVKIQNTRRTSYEYEPNNAIRKMNKNKLANTNNILQYYYNNFNNDLQIKQNNLSVNNQTPSTTNSVLLDKFNQLKANNQFKAPFSSSKRPLSMRLSTPKHVLNFFNRTLFRSDSQKRPLLLNQHLNSNSFNNSNQSISDEWYSQPNFQIIPARSGLKISSIYTITENVEKFSLKNTFYRNRNLYHSSNSRPLFVRK